MNQVPPLDEFQLLDSRYNVAVSDILTHLEANAVDLAGNYLLASAQRTLTGAIEDVIQSLRPSPEETPCVRVMGGTKTFPISSVTFLRSDGYWILPLYFIYHAQGIDNFEELRESHLDACIKWLEEPDESTPLIGLSKEGWTEWGFKVAGWNCTIDHDTPLKFLKMINLEPPYYCSRVDLAIEINEIR